MTIEELIKAERERKDNALEYIKATYQSTRAGEIVKDMKFDYEGDYVRVTFHSGPDLCINVAMDSDIAFVFDVTQAIYKFLS